MTTEETSLDLNNSPERSGAPSAAVVEVNQWRPEGYEDPPNPIDSSPDRELKGGTAKKDPGDYTVNEVEDEEEQKRELVLTQRQDHNWPLRRTMSLTNDLNAHAVAAPESAWNLSPSQLDASNSSTAGSENLDKKKRRAEEIEEDANNRPYECRFCEMKFSKSQALGGHMNRHRQEREREQIQQARALIMSNMHNSIHQGGMMTSVFQNSGIPSPKFQQRASSLPLPSQISGIQIHQHTGTYHQSPLSWSQGSSSLSYAKLADNTNFGAKQEDWPSIGRSTAYGASQSDMSFLSQGRNQDLVGMPYERNTQSPSNLFPPEAGVLPLQRGGLLQRQGSGGHSSPTIAGLTERRFNSTFHQSASYPFLGGEYNLSNAAVDGASQSFNMQGSSSIHQGTSLITPPNSSSIPPAAAAGDLAGKSAMGALSSDYENLWPYSQQQKATNRMSSIPNDEFGLSLNSDTLVNVHMANSPGTGISVPGETSGRQRINVGTDSSSLSFGIDYNAEIESKFNQGIPKDS